MKKETKYYADGTPKQTIGRVIKNNAKMLGKIAKFSPHYLIAAVLSGIIGGLRSSATALFTVKLFNGIDNGESLETLLIYIGVYAAWIVLSSLYMIFSRHLYEPWANEIFVVNQNKELYLRVHKMDEACFDDPEFYDDFVWSLNYASPKAESLVRNLRGVISPVVTFISIFSLVLELDPIIAVLIFILSVQKVISCILGNKIEYKAEREFNKIWRVKNYITRVFQLPDRSKEIRTSHVSDILMDMHEKNTKTGVETDKKYGFKRFCVWTLLESIMTTVGYYFIIIYMIGKLSAGLLLIGAFAATINVVWNIQWRLYEIVDALSAFPATSVFFERYFSFLATEPRITNGKTKMESVESIDFENVSFSYDFTHNQKFNYHKKDWEKPESTQGNVDALKDVTLSVKRGEKIAIVGYNGAGKTTLIKLLMRLYDPTSGRILINGKDIKEYDADDFRGKIGVVFQDFKIFATSVAENVMKGEYDPEKDKDVVYRALGNVEFNEKLNKLDHGIDTILTREFDPKGTNLSGGEGQKVAIARVFARPYDLIIMDEPSSALDPIAEYEINQNILKYSEGKTVIFISHRLSTTRMADRIYMFEKGNLIEHGSHDELMKLGGKYAEIFNLQAEKYIQ